jgi:hypothetical protein
MGVYLALLLLLGVGPAGAQQELGVAAGYRGDIGIDADPAVVFIENFEHAHFSSLLSRWEAYQGESLMSFSLDTPPGSRGMQSLFMDGSADLYRRVLPGYEQLYVRVYARFEAECTEVHHWLWMGGHNPSTAWPWPRAGERPVGDERWSTGIEPMGTRWAWDFYTYWMHMRGNPGGPQFWGNTFSGRPSPWPTARDEWICVEFMVRMNDPVDAFNGEQAFWIDALRKAHLGEGFPLGDWVWDGFYPDPGGQPFEGFQWRSVPELNINYVWLEQYVDTDPDCGVRFDDLVVATEYIGPLGIRALLRAEGVGPLRPGDPAAGPTRIDPGQADTLAWVPAGPASWRAPGEMAGGGSPLVLYEVEPEGGGGGGGGGEVLLLVRDGADLMLAW